MFCKRSLEGQWSWKPQLTSYPTPLLGVGSWLPASLIQVLLDTTWLPPPRCLPETLWPSVPARGLGAVLGRVRLGTHALRRARVGCGSGHPWPRLTAPPHVQQGGTVEFCVCPAPGLESVLKRSPVYDGLGWWPGGKEKCLACSPCPWALRATGCCVAAWQGGIWQLEGPWAPLRVYTCLVGISVSSEHDIK